MVHSLCRARLFRVAATVFLVVFAFAVSSPTYADGWGNGKGSERSSAASQGGGAVHGQGVTNGGGPGEHGPSWKTDTSTTDTTSTTGNGTGSDWNRSGDDLGQPQPLSNADRNPDGANGQCPGGPHCSTRDGSPSMNGNGQDHAHGKPCAGCVGKADNKNPWGQRPGHDHNNGYECDGNHGIGQTNPAHSGCKGEEHKPPKEHKPCKKHEEQKPEEQKPEVKPPAPPEQEQPEVKPPAEVPAQHVPPQAPRPPAQVPAAPAPAVQAPAAPVPAPAAQLPAQAALPPTGADALDTVLAVGGAGLLLTGTVLLLRRRRTSGTS